MKPFNVGLIQKLNFFNNNELKNLINKDWDLISSLRLFDFVKICNKYYYFHKELLISDDVYDSLLSFLKKDLTGYNIEKGHKLFLQYPMLSIKSGSSNDKLEKFLFRMQKHGVTSVLLQPKVDGIAVGIEKKILTNDIVIYSRGNGIEGEKLNYLIDQKYFISNFNLNLFQNNFALRGEMYVEKDWFKKQKFDLDFSNERTMVVSIIRSKKHNLKYINSLKIIYYDVYSKTNFKTEMEKLKILNTYSQDIIPYIKLNIKEISFKKIHKYFNLWNNTLNFLLDGIVIKSNDCIKNKKIGYTAKYPNFMFAVKKNSEIWNSKVIESVMTVGRTGLIGFLIWIKPIIISKRTIRKIFSKKPLEKSTSVKIVLKNGLIPYFSNINVLCFKEISFQCRCCFCDLYKYKKQYYCLNMLCIEKFANAFSFFLKTKKISISTVLWKKVLITNNNIVVDIIKLNEWYKVRNISLSRQNNFIQLFKKLIKDNGLENIINEIIHCSKKKHVEYKNIDKFYNILYLWLSDILKIQR